MNSPSTPAHDLMDRAAFVYNVITGNTVLYTDECADVMSADKSDFEDGSELYEVDAHTYLANAVDSTLEVDRYGHVVQAEVVVDYSPTTTIDLVNNTIVSRYGDYAVTIEFTDYYIKLDLLEELLELRENALI